MFSPYLGTSPTDSIRYGYGVDVAPKQSWVEITDESGNQTRSYTDVFGNEVKTVRGAHMGSPSTTVLGYNVLGQRVQVTDPRGLGITYGMGTRGLLVRRTSPDAGTVRHKYDTAGNARFTQDAIQAAAGKVLFHNYDFAGRPLVSGLGTATFTTLDPDAAPTSLETTNTNWHTVRKYDAKPTNVYPWSSFWTQISPLTLSNVAGRLAAVASKSNGAWQVTLYSYDTHGGIAVTHTFTQNDAGNAVLTAINTTTTYQRDLRGEITKRSTTVGSSSFYQWYEYDNRGLLEKVFASTSSTKPGSPDVTYSYGADGSPITRQFAGDASIPFKYTIRGQLRSISSLTSGTTPFAAQYAWKRNGTIDTVEFRSNGSQDPNKRYRYVASYDGKNQLTAAQYAYHNGSYTNSDAYRLNGIAYDLSGNLSTLTRYRDAATVIDNLSYTTASGSNRINSIADAIGSTTEDWDVQTGSFTYDANGSMKTAPAPYGITAMTYDHANLPISITGNGVTSTYRYNAQSQRIAKKVGSGSTDIYVLEGPTTLGVFSVNGAGSVTGSHFNVLAGGRVVGRLLSGGNKRFYHTDLLGSTRAVVEGSSIVESYDYDPWGVLMAGRTLDGPTRELFTGKERDETGLDYFGFRYYMSSVGRWTTLDPPADAFPSWSPYNYVFNNVLLTFDPDGRCPPEWVCNLIGASAGQEAVEYYAEIVADPASSDLERAGATVGGLFASLWTPDTYRETAGTLVAAAAASRLVRTYGGKPQPEPVGSKPSTSEGAKAIDRNLPRDRHGRPVPDSEYPHTQLGGRTSRSSGERYRQAREFDAEGRPVRDVDFTDHARPRDHPNPHQHIYDPDTGKRGPPTPLVPRGH